MEVSPLVIRSEHRPHRHEGSELARQIFVSHALTLLSLLLRGAAPWKEGARSTCFSVSRDFAVPAKRDLNFCFGPRICLSVDPAPSLCPRFAPTHLCFPSKGRLCIGGYFHCAGFPVLLLFIITFLSFRSSVACAMMIPFTRRN